MTLQQAATDVPPIWLKHNAGLAVVLAASMLFVCRVALAMVLIPPWQQPDEPIQLAWSEVSLSRLRSVKSSDPGRQSEILQSMASYDWWKHYGAVTPAPVPVRFLQAGGGTISIDPTENRRTTYYTLVAAVLWLAPFTSVVLDLYLMRAMSAVFALLTLWVVWRGTRDYLDATSGGVIVTLLALHPQFAVVATTAGPDALVDFLAACIWWQAVLALRRTDFFWPLLRLWAVAVVAAIVDRMGIPLLLTAFLFSMVTLIHWAGFRRAAPWLVLTSVLLGASIWALEVIWRTFTFAHWERLMPVAEAQTWDFFSRFTGFLFQSWWLSLGWVRYAAPGWWSAILAVLTSIAFTGALVRWWRDDRQLSSVIGLAAIMIAVEITAEFWIYYRFAYMPQGRHLFPALVPSLVLLWVGLERWVPRRYRQHAAVAAVALFAVIDFAVWALVAVPAYLDGSTAW